MSGEPGASMVATRISASMHPETSSGRRTVVNPTNTLVQMSLNPMIESSPGMSMSTSMAASTTPIVSATDAATVPVGSSTALSRSKARILAKSCPWLSVCSRERSGWLPARPTVGANTSAAAATWPMVARRGLGSLALSISPAHCEIGSNATRSQAPFQWADHTAC